MADLDVRDLTVEYSSGGYVIRPLDGLDLRACSGELVLLVGASGCGKTTLLSTLAAILNPTAGTVRFGDIEVTALRGKALTEYRRRTVGVAFQGFNLVPSMTALENVATPLWGAKVPGRRARARATTLLGQVGLEDCAHRRPGDLSGGQQQRVGIARALVHDPPLLLADEPTAHLDYVQVEGVLRILRNLATPGRMVVVATHDERLMPLADRVVELSPRLASVLRPPERLVLAPGQRVFEQGSFGDLIYAVDEGEIEILRRKTSGEEELVARLGPGRYFGELAPLFGLRRSATARARAAAVVTGYTVGDFRKFVHPGPLADLVADAAGGRSPAASTS